MQNYQNTDVFPRTWGLLIDLSTSRTLTLGPGEATTDGVGAWVYQTEEVDGETVPNRDLPMVEGDLPADFEDEYLKPVTASAARRLGRKGAKAGDGGTPPATDPPADDTASTDGATDPDAPAPADGDDKPKE